MKEQLNPHTNSTGWNKDNWKKFPISQQPEYSDMDLVEKITENISKLPSLVHYEDINELKEILKKCHKNEKFIIQIGDCAERFVDCDESVVQKKLEFYTLIQKILEYHLNKEVIILGRIGGQYAKPRSSPFEIINDEKYESYRGDIINSHDCTDRKPNPNRMLEAYYKSASTMNYIQNFNQHDIKSKNEAFQLFLDDKESFGLSEDITSKLIYYSENFPKEQIDYDLNGKIYTSHEALLLKYESCFLREFESKFYNLSGHFVWIGERTNNIHDAHLEFFRGLENPIGLKISARIKIDDLIEIIKVLNPKNEMGKIFLITRYGMQNIIGNFEPLLIKIKENNLNVCFICDPNHGNTKSDPITNKKIRYFEDLKNEIILTNKILVNHGLVMSGIHLEATYLNVTECFGGISLQINSIDCENYTTFCDPRLNIHQTIELSDSIGKALSQI